MWKRSPDIGLSFLFRGINIVYYAKGGFQHEKF